MGKIVMKLPLKKSFIYAVSCLVVIIVCLSSLTIFSCYYLQKKILPNSNEGIIYITSVNQYGEEDTSIQRFRYGEETSIPMNIATGIFVEGETDTDELKKDINMASEFTIDKIENSFSALSSKRKAVYMTLAVVKVALPFLYSIIGIVMCGAWFYKKKLSVPIRLLSEAAKNISEQNLDFELTYASTDEMGMLCRSFEKMRHALYENNKKLWKMVEDRRVLMASVAHDLRNPISIIESYVEYLQFHILNRNMDKEDILEMIDKIAISSARLERYTDSLRDIHYLEEQELQKTICRFPELVDDISEAFLLFNKQKKICVEVENSIPRCEVLLDGQILYRILENIYMNALRYARSRIHIHFEMQGDYLAACIADDGKGFPEKLLHMKPHLFFTTDQTGEHMGMGLAVCEILCKKHDGSLEISNLLEGGAKVSIKIAVKKITELEE